MSGNATFPGFSQPAVFSLDNIASGRNVQYKNNLQILGKIEHRADKNTGQLRVICVDAGNTYTKLAVIRQKNILSSVSFPSGAVREILQYVESLPPADACIVSDVGIIEKPVTDALSAKVGYFLELTARTPVPVHNMYATPETLGKDRLAAVVGAHCLYPGKNLLVIDAGTALTVDFVDHLGNYRGGNISPGLKMRFRALHGDTKRLPLAEQTDNFQLIGDSTLSAVVSGVQLGMIFEIDSYIDHFEKQNPDLITIMTGGDTFFFENKIEKCIFAQPNLVIIGLEDILKYNWYNLNK
jgi:type III pantothenate kinase